MTKEGKDGWMYIMADRYRGATYVGVTADLATRIHQHRNGGGSVHCAKHNLDRLVWAERGDDILSCIAHEKRMKRWHRNWKFELIERTNPQWRELSPTII
ncbi:GIY-YIG nuclease family protein [Sphingomonas sp. 2R-10]|uniref:GIY-YIG nuclease family protein n=1 Tax=Sphingomonas sp. 2R-10 TaxID=3045148 RepID=UPI000F786E4B|nr:GIY-YIG nuclease family protein [Sphingomonas sp. 2R-10]MDJ0277234.1 GIY-YIG nuclease family protein [Sphingomonas sp. 2R-10]